MESWFDELNDNLTNKFGTKLMEGKSIKKPDKEKISENEIIEFNDIKNIKFSNIDEFTLLKYQMILSGSLRKYFKNMIDNYSIINYDLCKEQLNWLFKSSEYLSNKYKMTPIKTIYNGSIHRSSYKFCQRGSDCELFYKRKCCNQQHFVYNIISADISSLILYLRDKEYEVIEHIEVQKTINTISYVINHMYVELNNLVYYKYNISNLDKLIKH